MVDKRKKVNRYSEDVFESLQNDRDLSVVKRDDMIQKARLSLTVQEQRCVLYAITKIKPEDKAFSEYTFDIKYFYELCGVENRSYTRLKQILRDLSDKSWWIVTDREKGEESLVRWFSTLKVSQKSGKVTLKFHEDMMPYLLELAKQGRNGEFFTQYGLRFVLPMRSQFSPRLYELLKSYQKNNHRWYFAVDDLRYLLDCQQYTRWPDLRRRVIEPAINEINEYTDLKISYDTETSGKKVVKVRFFILEKPADQIGDIRIAIDKKLDGELDFEEIVKKMENDLSWEV